MALKIRNQFRVFKALIRRFIEAPLLQRLSSTPAVALLGSRQVGKTTLARELKLDKPTHYIDLERPSDLAKLADPELYLGRLANHLVFWMKFNGFRICSRCFAS